VLLPSAAVATFLGASYYFFDYFNVLRDDVSELMVTTFNVVATVVFIERLASAALSVRLPAWRLIPVENGPARALYWLVLATAMTAGVDFIMSRINSPRAFS
jgi:small-conductance mechanosensitive channel